MNLSVRRGKSTMSNRNTSKKKDMTCRTAFRQSSTHHRYHLAAEVDFILKVMAISAAVSVAKCCVM